MPFMTLGREKGGEKKGEMEEWSSYRGEGQWWLISWCGRDQGGGF
jgi:hypothetical protein